MSTKIPANTSIPSAPPNNKPDLWRERIQTLAGRSNLTVKSEEEWDEKGFWWSAFHLTNADGSKSCLGSHSGKTKAVAREHAAKQSYGTLSTVVNTWTQNAMANAAQSTSTAVSAYSAPPTETANSWTHQFERFAGERNFTFVCEEQHDSQQTWVVTYHLTNPDGSKHCLLGSQSATTSNIARENAAYHALNTLNYLIEMWRQPGPSGGSTSAGASGN